MRTYLSLTHSFFLAETNPLSLVPKPYRQVEIKYTKLGRVISCYHGDDLTVPNHSVVMVIGIEMFDFGHYNDSKFAGLEIHIPNAYCNSMLQASSLPPPPHTHTHSFLSPLHTLPSPHAVPSSPSSPRNRYYPSHTGTLFPRADAVCNAEPCL